MENISNNTSSVQVVGRCRNAKYEATDKLICESNKVIIQRLKGTEYILDQIFTPLSSTLDIYNNCAINKVNEFLLGQNACILAIGECCTGKTFTIEGNKENIGIMHHAAHTIFERRTEGQKIFVRYIELFNEKIYDLNQTVLEKRQKKVFSSKNENEGVSWYEIQLEDEFKLWVDACNNRRQNLSLGARQNMSILAGRQHSVISFQLRGDNSTSSEYPQLDIMDTAGSEKIKFAGYPTKETKNDIVNINQSLRTLYSVIEALAKKSKFVPYRESKITNFLIEGLGGNCQTLIIATFDPSDKYLADTANVLSVAEKARRIENHPVQIQNIQTQISNTATQIESNEGQIIEQQMNGEELIQE